MGQLHPASCCGHRVLLFRGRGLLSALIRWQTRSRFSHAALLMPDGRIIEAWPWAGVRVTRLADWEGVEAFSIPSMTEAQWELAVSTALTTVGAGYDWRGILRFLSRRKMRHNTRWFCSELVTYHIHLTGVRLLERIECAAICPGKLSLSPLLHAEPTPSCL